MNWCRKDNNRSTEHNAQSIASGTLYTVQTDEYHQHKYIFIYLFLLYMHHIDPEVTLFSAHTFPGDGILQPLEWIHIPY